jgi:hypothetical protein
VCLAASLASTDVLWRFGWKTDQRPRKRVIDFPARFHARGPSWTLRWQLAHRVMRFKFSPSTKSHRFSRPHLRCVSGLRDMGSCSIPTAPIMILFNPVALPPENPRLGAGAR